MSEWVPWRLFPLVLMEKIRIKRKARHVSYITKKMQHCCFAPAGILQVSEGDVIWRLVCARARVYVRFPPACVSVSVACVCTFPAYLCVRLRLCPSRVYVRFPPICVRLRLRLRLRGMCMYASRLLVCPSLSPSPCSSLSPVYVRSPRSCVSVSVSVFLLFILLFAFFCNTWFWSVF